MHAPADSDTHSADGPDHEPDESTQRKRLLRKIARTAVYESIAGFQFGGNEEAVQELCRLHTRVQFLKAQGTNENAEALNRARNERGVQAFHVARLLIAGLNTSPLPPSIETAVAEFLAANPDQHEAQIESAPATDAPVADNSGATEPKHTPPGDGETDNRVRIHGLEAIPTFGEPLPVFNVPESPETWEDRVKNRLEDADYWYERNRRIVLWSAVAFALFLVVLNLTVLGYATYRELNPIPETGAASLGRENAVDADGLDSDALIGATGSAQDTNARLRGRVMLFAPLVLTVLGALAYFAYRSRRKGVELAQQYSLRALKAILVPVDVAVRRGFSMRFVHWDADEPAPTPPKENLTTFERRTRVAQAIALVLLVMALLFPPGLQAARHYWSAESSIQKTAMDGDTTLVDASGRSAQEVGIGRQIRAQYIWLTAVLILIVVMVIVVYVMRKIHLASRKHIRIVGMLPLEKGARDKLAAEPKSWRHGEEDAARKLEPPINHEDPYGAMALEIAQSAKIRSLASLFRLEARIARYRIFNKWNILYVFALITDNTLRFLGIIVFAGLLVFSVIMPLLLLSMFHADNIGRSEALRSLIKEYFPEMAENESDSVPNDPDGELLSLDPDGTIRGLKVHAVNLEPTASGPPLAAWFGAYAFALTAIAASNILLLGTRVVARRRARNYVAGSSWRLSVEAAASSTVVVLSLLGVAFLWGLNYRYGASYANAAAAERELGQWHRNPRDLSRVFVLTKDKFFSQQFLPELAFDKVWYVDAKSRATVRDGQSWDTAFHTLYGGIQAAVAEGGGEVWVGSGAYPLMGGAVFDSGGHGAALIIPANVHVYGGFLGASPGGYEGSRLERNWLRNVTVLVPRGVHVSANEYPHILGVGKWTLDGVVVIGGRICAMPATADQNGPMTRQGVLANLTHLFPEGAGTPETTILGNPILRYEVNVIGY